MCRLTIRSGRRKASYVPGRTTAIPVRDREIRRQRVQHRRRDRPRRSRLRPPSIRSHLISGESSGLSRTGLSCEGTHPGDARVSATARARTEGRPASQSSSLPTTRPPTSARRWPPCRPRAMATGRWWWPTTPPLMAPVPSSRASATPDHGGAQRAPALPAGARNSALRARGRCRADRAAGRRRPLVKPNHLERWQVGRHDDERGRGRRRPGGPTPARRAAQRGAGGARSRPTTTWQGPPGGAATLARAAPQLRLRQCS